MQKTDTGPDYLRSPSSVPHPADEAAFLNDIACIFGLDPSQSEQLRDRYEAGALFDPYGVLGVTPEDDLDDIRSAWRRLARNTHPDITASRTDSTRSLRYAEQRMALINRAWNEISSEHI